MGYKEATPIQAQAIPAILQKGDLIGSAQTGTGKTAAFALPILQKLWNHRPKGMPRALILEPTRELAAQVLENFQKLGSTMNLKAALVHGGVGFGNQRKALQEGADILIATPGRLLDLYEQRDVRLSDVEVLVLDEADRMLDMGFLPAIRRVLNSLPKKRQTLLFSATLSKEIEALTHEFQHQPKTVQIGRRSNPAETVTQLVYEVPRHLKASLLAYLLKDPGMNMVLVFTRTKHGADRVARRLESIGIKTATLHANRSQNQRLRALADFRSGAVRVLVATDIAARGIDVEALGHVVNFDVPLAAEDYIHRVGRTARAEATGEAFTFVSPDEEGDLKQIERAIKKTLPRVTVPDFDYSAKPQTKLEVPLAERIAEIRKKKAEDRARAAAKVERRSAAQSGGARPSAPSGGRPAAPARKSSESRGPSAGSRGPSGGGAGAGGGAPKSGAAGRVRRGPHRGQGGNSGGGNSGGGAGGSSRGGGDSPYA